MPAKKSPPPATRKAEEISLEDRKYLSEYYGIIPGLFITEQEISLESIRELYSAHHPNWESSRPPGEVSEGFNKYYSFDYLLEKAHAVLRGGKPFRGTDPDADPKGTPDIPENPFGPITRGTIKEFLGNQWKDPLENEEILRRFLRKSIQAAADHSEEYKGNFNKGSPGDSEFKKYKFLITQLLPEWCAHYIPGFRDTYLAVIEAAKQDIGKGIGFSWDEFLTEFDRMPLRKAAAVFRAEIDGDVWPRRKAAAAHQKYVDGGKTTGRLKTLEKERRKGLIYSFKKQHPKASLNTLKSDCRDALVPAEIPRSTFNKLWLECSQAPL